MENCPRQPLAEDYVTTTALLIEHLITLIVLVLWIRASYRTVELAHPMFGLLFQEMIVFALFNLLNIVTLLAITFTKGSKTNAFAGIYIFTDLAALQFHQVTCLAVTCLRYYLLYVVKPNQEIDMSRVYKVSFFGVWIAELILLPLGQMIWMFTISQKGWPDKRISEIARDNQGFLAKLTFVSLAFSNLPDYLSIILYIKMYMFAKTAVNPEVDVPNQEAFGGIWVGEDLPPIQHDNAVEAQAPNSQNQDKLKSISKLLKLNAIFCLVDLTTVALWDQLFCKGLFATVMSFTVQNLISYWIPMLVLGLNFRKFRGFWPCNANDENM